MGGGGAGGVPPINDTLGPPSLVGLVGVCEGLPAAAQELDDPALFVNAEEAGGGV